MPICRPGHTSVTIAILSRCVVLLAAACGGTGTEPADDPGTAPAAAVVTGASHVCALTPDGQVSCWGRGAEGQLGVGSTPATAAPPGAAAGGSARFVAVAAGRAHTCALDQEGAAFCWGADDTGQLGLDPSPVERCGLVDCSSMPESVGGGHRFTAIVTGHRFSCGLEAAGEVWCWGAGDVGQLGHAVTDDCGGFRCSRVPVRVEGDVRLRTLTAGSAHVCGLDAAGAAICWGYNYQGQLGRGDRTDSPTARPVAGGQRFLRLSAGGLHTCGITMGGAAFCWGIDAIGAGPAVRESTVPVAVAGAAAYAEIQAGRYTSCAVRTDGLAECWGANLDSELGVPSLGATQRADEPVRTVSELRFATLAGKYSTYCGTAVDGGLYCWGKGDQGQLGFGTENSAAPVAVVPAARSP